MERPYIHPFTTPGGYYIFDVNTDTILRVSEEIYRSLKDCGDFGSLLNSNRQIANLHNNGFLSSKRSSEVLHPATGTLSFFLKNKISMIILQVTQNCNLRCKYCAYSGSYHNRTHSNRTMNFETAKKGIDFLISHSTDNEHINVSFYGGEPLLMFNLIKSCIEYAEFAAEGKDISFNITSNGTLITDDVIKYFIDHNVKLTISLDGPREVHDKNRRFAKNGEGSFDIIYKKITHIKTKFPEYYKDNIGFNMVIDPSVDLGCVNNFVCRDEIFSDPYLSSSIIDDRYRDERYDMADDFIPKLKYERFKLFLNKLNRLSSNYVSPLTKIEYDLIVKARGDKLRGTRRELPDKSHHSGPCIPGKQRLFLDVNGNFFPCERVSEKSQIMNIGNIDSGIDVNKSEYLLNVGRATARQCKECWAFQYCTVCAGAIDDLEKISTDLANRKCPSVRANVEYNFKSYCTLREFGNDCSSYPIDYAVFE